VSFAEGALPIKAAPTVSEEDVITETDVSTAFITAATSVTDAATASGTADTVFTTTAAGMFTGADATIIMETTIITEMGGIIWKMILMIPTVMMTTITDNRYAVIMYTAAGTADGGDGYISVPHTANGAEEYVLLAAHTD